MRSDTAGGGDRNHLPPFAGYTYLGQFIDHDLTLDLTPLALAGKTAVTATPNFRSPRFDLDHLYGGGLELTPFLFRSASPPGEERFCIGMTRPAVGEGRYLESSLNDLPRNSDGAALASDPRQDENLNLAQLHVTFLRSHNRLLDNSELLNASPHYKDVGSRFKAAQRALTWHYQWIIRHDFLRQILDPEIFAQLEGDQALQVGPPSGDFAVPVEFSLAAFRFGHSVVRDDYFFNDFHRAAALADLFRLTGRGGGATPALPADWVIDWKRFFFVGAAVGSARHSERIDTIIADGLHQLPGDSTVSPHLPVRTLQRGERVGLPAGQRVAEALGFVPLQANQIANGADGDTLRKYGYDAQTPLWYYILKEAEIIHEGRCLGTTGSKIVAEVILGALLSDPDSYVSVDPAWRPTLPHSGPPESYGMSDLLRFAQAAS